MGILSAVKDPAAACLRVVGPVRSSAHGIMEATLPFLHSCRLCHLWIGAGPVYIYKGERGFCKPECRDEYIVQEERAKAIMPSTKTKTPTLDDGCIFFFTCTDSP
ncbi:hypothetical protein BRADI_1g20810v3 [Brachypodium distachyon]|uniref:FLZ-type domain-containing protein n=2 Tax=Brachypodium distachyon TaxID=15368 RepID=I1GS54_BRADI|nr:hypothetical protein BRADI_1g20810v3 [Brachypodium distachyon]